MSFFLQNRNCVKNTKINLSMHVLLHFFKINKKIKSQEQQSTERSFRKITTGEIGFYLVLTWNMYL